MCRAFSLLNRITLLDGKNSGIKWAKFAPGKDLMNATYGLKMLWAKKKPFVYVASADVHRREAIKSPAQRDAEKEARRAAADAEQAAKTQTEADASRLEEEDDNISGQNSGIEE